MHFGVERANSRTVPSGAFDSAGMDNHKSGRPFSGRHDRGMKSEPNARRSRHLR
jgi:hypothetical protein